MRKVEYFVTKREQCKRCKGEGQIYKEHWQKYEDNRYRGVVQPSFSEYLNTYGPVLFDFCPDCLGKGWKEEIVSLREALQDIMGWREGEEDGE